MNKYTKVIVALALLALAPITQAQTLTDVLATWVSGTPMSNNKTADDTDVIIKVKYLGPQPSALVAVSAAGALTFTTGLLGAEVADTTFECPVSGALGGVVDVSNAACDTVGEVVNAINTSPNWLAVPVDSLYSDDINCGGSGCLKLLAAAQATGVGGLSLVSETSVQKSSTHSFLPLESGDFIKFFTTANAPQANANIKPNPMLQYRSWLAYYANTNTFTGVNTGSIYCVLPNYKRGTAGTNGAGSGSETVITLNTQAGGATGVLKTYFTVTDNVHLVCPDGFKMIARTAATTTFSAATGSSLAYRFIP